MSSFYSLDPMAACVFLNGDSITAETTVLMPTKFSLSDKNKVPVMSCCTGVKSAIHDCLVRNVLICFYHSVLMHACYFDL